MIDLIIASGNRAKIREFREMLGDGGIRWCEMESLGPAPHVEESGKTFRANACLKASAYATHYKRWALADDSGLEVDALGGSPGVYSARWAEMHEAGKGDQANNELLLKQLQEVPDDERTGRFVCVLALSDDEGRIVLTARKTVEGRILREPRGSNGFGYDPLFFVESHRRTTAELGSDEKHRISHRGKALRVLRELMATAGIMGIS